MFRIFLETGILNNEKKSNAGAEPYDVVLMFKIGFTKILRAG